MVCRNLSILNQIDFVLIVVRFFRDKIFMIADIVVNLLDMSYNFASVEEIAWQFFSITDHFLESRKCFKRSRDNLIDGCL